MFLSLRNLGIFLFLLTRLSVSQAQTFSTSAPYTSSTLTRADTARAVHELFRSRRGGGTGWLAFGTAGILASTLPAQQTTSAGIWTPGVVAGSAFLLLGVKKRIQFRPGRERQLLRDLAATGHVPASVTRRLHGNFAPVHGTATAPNPLAAYGDASDMPLAAQPAPTPAQQLAEARQDTLDIVRGFFLAKNFAGQLPLTLALPGLRLMAGGTNTDYTPSPYLQPQTSKPGGGQVAAGLALMAGGVAYMFIHNAPYTNAKYEALRTDYLAGKPLPTAIRTKLKPKHLAAGRAYRERQERKAARRAKR
ncbi:hypothetical protein [Hymenobacter bucti]|uniref:DUF4235 domain-containing protein n=1 Tax=Hymenobacter bucti TaxID=1844114 RepID=A0ABW4QS21_9BACT